MKRYLVRCRVLGLNPVYWVSDFAASLGKLFQCDAALAESLQNIQLCCK